MIGAIIAQRKVREGIENINRRDIDAILAGWADDGVYIYPGKVSGSGRFEGKEAIRKWYENTFEQFPVIKMTVNHVMVENIFDFTGTNVIAVNVDILVQNLQGTESGTCSVNLFKIKKGKIVEGRVFHFGSREEIDEMASRGEADVSGQHAECPWDKEKASGAG